MPYGGNPATSPSDKVRFLLGDVESDAKLSDDEIAYLLSEYTEPVRAAYQGALRLLARYSGRMSKTVGPTNISYGDLVTQYRALLADLKAMGGATGSAPLAGAPTAGGLDEDLWSDVDWNGDLK